MFKICDNERKLPAKTIKYSQRYTDEKYEYRHVILPPHLAKLVPRPQMMTETEWRNLGVQQSSNWVHYMKHTPEPHILLFRRPLKTNNSNEF
ncbi:cyclin-dependent kinases regulatory subunit-like [Diorhabda sublineata]|uniref:cyclin-dependent kinases regulatory subunit-like n=1 Tax=Diorhabda sublineata TaxID=1163346 RepID=UPI0024E0DFFC|nr:cyclin-dependent kinases regulatory subunit-like [Diorhabda sublineata]